MIMNSIVNKEEAIHELLKEDVLYKLIEVREELKSQLFNDDYLNTINTNQYYSPTEIASWMDTKDGTIRYYIKPFFDYIFEDDVEAPISEKTLRLGFKSILKVRMILLLKKEFKVTGLKQVIEKTPRVIKKHQQEVGPANQETANEIMLLLKQVLDTGIFELSKEDQVTKIKLSNDLAEVLSTAPYMKKMLENNNEMVLKELEEVKDKQYNQLRESLELEIEAEEAYQKKFKYGPLTRLFKLDKIQLEKKQFILEYIMKKQTGKN